MGIILAILMFSFIVFFHELGHFTLAKKNGIDVEEFAIGMGPNLFAKEYKGTKYCIKLLPIGGLCMMGEDEEVTDAPGNFNNKSVILAFVAAVVLILMIGIDKPVVGAVEQGFPAAEAGLKEGDVITGIGGEKVHIFREISSYNQFHQGETTEITFLRDGVERGVVLTPQFDDSLGYYKFGIGATPNEKATVFESLQYGLYEVKYWIEVTIDSLKMLVTGQIGFDQLSGPVGIVDVVDDSYQQSKAYGAKIVFAQLLYIGILISANLGVMNLLPLPALDGGRLVFLFVEAVRKKRIPPEKEAYVHMVGIALLMLLMVVVMFNDIRRVFF